MTDWHRNTDMLPLSAYLKNF